MFWNRYFWPSSLVLIAVGILHWIASSEGYYWTVGWWDFMMHFLGGAWVTLVTLWISETTYGAFLKPYISFRKVLLFTIFIGVVWEIFEIVMGFSDIYMAGYTWDTTHDLIMDTVGSFVALKTFFPKK